MFGFWFLLLLSSTSLIQPMSTSPTIGAFGGSGISGLFSSVLSVTPSDILFEGAGLLRKACQLDSPPDSEIKVQLSSWIPRLVSAKKVQRQQAVGRGAVGRVSGGRAIDSSGKQRQAKARASQPASISKKTEEQSHEQAMKQREGKKQKKEREKPVQPC